MATLHGLGPTSASQLVGNERMLPSRREVLRTHRPCLHEVPDVPLGAWQSTAGRHLNISTGSKQAGARADRRRLNVKVATAETHTDNEIPIDVTATDRLIALLKRTRLLDRYLATGAGKGISQAWRMREEATRETKTKKPTALPFYQSIAMLNWKNTSLRTRMNSNLYLRLWSWKFNDITSKCRASTSESALGGASSQRPDSGRY